MTTMSTNLLSVCHAPQKEYWSYGTPVLSPTVPKTETVSKSIANTSKPGDGIAKAVRSTMHISQKAMKSYYASEASCF